MAVPNKSERFTEFLRRLGVMPAAGSFDEAFRQIGDVLNAVEDEMTSIPYDPSRWRTDGRMYPPQEDSERSDSQPGVRRFHSRAHYTRIGSNGAIAIAKLSGAMIFSKPGVDGRSIDNPPMG